MVNNIIEEIKNGLTGDQKKDMEYLQQQIMKYQNHKNAVEILKEISDMAFALLPQEKQEQFKEIMFIGNKRLDQVYNDACECAKRRDIDGAIDILSQLEDMADKHFTLKNGYSFRNRLEEYLYLHIYKGDEKYIRTPFDFCKYLSFYGYLLIEKKDPVKAAEKLNKAIKYNPVNVEPRFELAEAYKLMGESEKLMECVKETLKVCITPQQIARCYTNLGYYCIDIKDYESAVAFYYESLIFAQDPAVSGELQHIRAITGKDIEKPTRDGILAAFEKYGIKNGPDQDIINLIYSLGCYCMEHNAPPEESMFYMQLVYGLSRDEKVQDTIDMLKAQIAARNAAQESRNK